MTATRFTQADVRRAVKGVTDAGLPVGEVSVMPDGRIRILTITPEGVASAGNAHSEGPPEWSDT